MNVVLKPDIPVIEVAVAAFIVMLVSIFASFQPAYRASKIEQVNA